MVGKWRCGCKNHNLGGVIARSCKGCEIADAILYTQTRGTDIQGREVQLHQFRVKNEAITICCFASRVRWVIFRPKSFINVNL